MRTGRKRRRWTSGILVPCVQQAVEASERSLGVCHVGTLRERFELTLTGDPPAKTRNRGPPPVPGRTRSLVRADLAPGPARLPHPRRRLGQAFVFQKPVLLRRSVRGDLAVALAARGVPRRERPARIAEALALVGLRGFERRAARSLSGGEQQRLALARAWALRPQLLFLDEPTASLDPAATRMVEAIVRDLAARGVTIVASTHDLGQARRLAQDILFLHAGRLLDRGPAEAFFERPASPEARAFLAGELPA